MTRTVALVALAVLLAGCTRYQTRGPFGKTRKDPPPPYGTVAPVTPQRPVGGQSPLGMASADPAPPQPPDERALIPPKPDALVPATGVVPSAPAGPAPQTGAQPAAPNPGAKNLAELKSLLATANAAWGRVTTYETVITRRELNPKGLINNEVVLFQYRRDPVSVFTRNVGESGKGRETVYNPGAHGDKLHILLGEGDSKLLRAGTLAPAPISPDDPRVKEKARYGIREAGFGRMISALSRAVASAEAGQLPADAVVFNGEVKRDEYPYPLVGVSHKLRPGDDPLMLTGGMRLYFFDPRPNSPSFGLPVVVAAFDAAGKEVEYYFADKVKNPAGLTDAHFNPSRLGK